MNTRVNYRPDIDGLRAIAVLSVLFYHGGIKIFQGGYIGVDVFFVISGYLITGIIVRELQVNKFSLVKFYERRIRRIYPVVFATISLTLIVSALMYDAPDFANVSKSAASITFFISNMLFWRGSGYFEGPSTLKPLLHTWSLSVEEQFYIVFPVLLMLIARFFKSRFKPAVITLALLSLTASIYSVYQYESAAFYFMPLRAWELLAGSALALHPSQLKIHVNLRRLISIIGIAIILTSTVLFSESTLFPGLSAIIPVSGSMLVIYSGLDGETFSKNILSLKPIVFIGKISYSLYLWHWPLLVIGKYYLIREMTLTDIFMWLVVTSTISILSWKFIENPFREATFLNTSKIFGLAGGVMLISMITNYVIYTNNGFPQRFASASPPAYPNERAEMAKWGGCLASRKKEFPKSISLCTVGFEAKKPIFLVWGDSHVRALAPAMDEAASKANIAGYISSRPGCPPLLGIDRQDQFLGTCNTYNNMIVDYIKNHPELKTIILASRWATSADGTRYKTEEGPTIKQIDIWTNQDGANAALFEIGLNRTIAKLLELDRNIVIVDSIPEVGYDVPSAYAIATRTGRDLNNIIAPTLQEYLYRNRDVLATINSIMKRSHIQVIEPSKALCDEKKCYVVIDSQPIYRDDDHLSIFGAHYISYLFDPIFEALQPNR